jgi:hydrogenase expression/formation protein HypC
LTLVKRWSVDLNKIQFDTSNRGTKTMCLGVPMRIKQIDGFSARCEARGIERMASLFLLQHEDLQVGDLVMIHVGNAIQKMSEEEAKSAWDLYDEILDLEAGTSAGGRLAAE